MRNQNISQLNRASGKSHVVLRHFVILSPSLCSLSVKILNCFLRWHLTKSAIYFPPSGKELKSYWPLWYCLCKLWSSVKKASLAVVFIIVTQRSSVVEANQNIAFDKRIVSKQKHKHSKPFGWTWAILENYYHITGNIEGILTANRVKSTFKCRI